MREVFFKNLSWQKIRIALSISLLREEPLCIKGGWQFLEKNFELESLWVSFKNFFDSSSCGILSTSGEDIIFYPQGISPGNIFIDTGAFTPLGEFELLLLPYLFFKDFRTVINFEGVTHAHISYSTSFFKESFFSFLESMVFYASMNLQRFGFYGSGGGRAESRVYPAEMAPADIFSFKERNIHGAKIFMANMNMEMAHKEKDFLQKNLSIAENRIQLIEVLDCSGMGNSIQIYIDCGGFFYIISADMEIYNSAGDLVFDEAKYYGALTSLVKETERFCKSKYIPHSLMADLLPYMLLSKSTIPEEILQSEEYELFLNFH